MVSVVTSILLEGLDFFVLCDMPGSGVLGLGGYTLNPEEPDKPYTVIWNPEHDAEYSVQVFVRSAESKRMIGNCIQQLRIP